MGMTSVMPVFVGWVERSETQLLGFVKNTQPNLQRPPLTPSTWPTQIQFVITLIMLFFFSTPTYALEKVTVILDWFPNADHAPLIAAQEQGFFQQQGLNVELISPAHPADPPKWVAAGKADIAISYQPHLMMQIDQGLPLLRIGTLIDQPLNCLVTLQESAIQHPRDLKGKRIGSGSGNSTDILLQTLLAKQHLRITDVEIIHIPYNLVSALLSKKVDAITDVVRNVEVPQLELAGKKVRVFLPEENGMPTYSEFIFIAHKNHAHDPRFPRFLIAVEKGVAYLKKHPNHVWQQFIKRYPEANNAFNQRAWQITVPYFTDHPTDFDAKKWQTFANFMRERGFIKRELH